MHNIRNDIIQKALYGRSQDVLSILCEDEESESLIRGMLDVLGPRLDFLQNDVEVGRNTGKDQYPTHLETFARFRKLGDVVFVLDGDAGPVRDAMERRSLELNQKAHILCLPGDAAPEIWVWKLLKERPDLYAAFFGLEPAVFLARLNALDDLFGGAADKPTAIAKNKLFTLVEENSRTLPALFRHIGNTEAQRKSGAVFELLTQLENTIREWRAGRA